MPAVAGNQRAERERPTSDARSLQGAGLLLEPDSPKCQFWIIPRDKSISTGKLSNARAQLSHIDSNPAEDISLAPPRRGWSDVACVKHDR